MKIFVTGATGYIGFQVSQGLRRNGHQVFGLTRARDSVARLHQAEIRAVIGSLQERQSYEQVAAQADVIVHAAVDYSTDSLALDQATVEHLSSLRTPGRQSPLLVYTSGVWVLGNTGDTPVTESSPLHPAALVVRRPAIEQRVLGANGSVIRPGIVYGKSGGLTGMWFSGAVPGRAVEIIGDGTNRWAMVHVDDLADAYVRLIEHRVRGQLFHVTDGLAPVVGQLGERIAALVPGSRSVLKPLGEARHQMGDFAEALTLDQVVDSSAVRGALGWTPTHDFAADVDLYLAAWQASH